jgi:hypothetical protein
VSRIGTRSETIRNEVVGEKTGICKAFGQDAGENGIKVVWQSYKKACCRIRLTQTSEGQKQKQAGIKRGNFVR